MTTPTIPPARLPAAEVDAPQTAIRNSSSPSEAGDDFGPLTACLIACPLGTLCWCLLAWCL